MNTLVTLTNNLAGRIGLNAGGDAGELIHTLKSTAFKGDVSDQQMIALLVVANQYQLNPWTKEIYAFPDGRNGIVPIVGVDGWFRIINEHKQFDGMDFEQDAESCTCIIYRKDRSHPIKATEYLEECVRQTGPWQSHPRRMLRHKAVIQCARIAFGFTGIKDEDEGERIIEAERDVTPQSINPAEGPTELPAYGELEFAENLPKWRELIEAGKVSAGQIIGKVQTKYALTEGQVEHILNLEPLEASA